MEARVAKEGETFLKEHGVGRKASRLSAVETMDENLKSGMGSTVESHGGEDVVHSVDGENIGESIRKVKENESNAVEETTDVQQSFGEQLWNLDELLALGQQCLDHFTVESSSEDLQETKTLLVNYMSLICEHRNQLDSRSLDLQTAVGDVASRFLYVLFLLEDYEECIRWFEMGISTEDALKKSLESSGSVQYNVAVSFLKSADVKTALQRLHYLIGRLCRHLERSFELQVEDFDSLKAKIQMKVEFDVATGIIAVTLGRLLLVPGEMFGKLLGTPFSHFTNRQVIHLLDEVLALAIGMKDKGWLVEGEAVLKMGVTFASKIEDEEMRDGFLKSIQMELRKPYEFTYQNQKVPKVDEVELMEALQSISSVETTEKNFKSGTEVASTSGDAEVEQPFEEQVWNLDELLTLGKECLDQCTVEGSLEDLQEAKTLLVNYMSLICEHRNQLGSRLDLQMAIGDVASRFLYVLFHLEEYEECIRWFELGIGTDDALKESLEASGSVQYNVAISFFKRSGRNADLQGLKTDQVTRYFAERGIQCLLKSCQLQVKDFDSLSSEMKNEMGIRVGAGIYVTMGNVELVPGSEMIEKLLGTPYSHFTHQQVQHLLSQILESTMVFRDKDWLVETEAVLKMGVAFASKIEDEEMSDQFHDRVLMQLHQLYRFRSEYQKAAQTNDQLSKFSQKISDFRERQLRESVRAEDWSLAGDHNRAIDIIITACSAVDVGDAPSVLLPHEDWKLKAHLKFTYGRILERARLVDEAIKQMEEAKAVCLAFNYNGDDDGVNLGLCGLLQLYGEVDEYIESALSLIDLIDPIMSKDECKEDFYESWLKEKGFIWHRIDDRHEANKCWADAEALRSDAGNDDDTGDEEKPDDLYEKYSFLWCGNCKGKHLRDPKSHFQVFFYLAKCRWKSIEAALEALEAAQLVVYRRRGGERCRLVDVHMLRGSLFFEHRNALAVEAYEMAVEILQTMNQDDYEIKSRLSICYGMQARVKLAGGSLDDGLHLIHKAAPVLEKENPGVYYYLQAMALRLQNQVEEAATLGEMAFKELIKTQKFKLFQTQAAESACIRTFEESTLLDVLKFNEMTSYWFMKTTRDALIWAERSRTRLYMRNTEDQPSVVCSTCELFDFRFEHAEELLGDVVLMCGPETAIISYSYCKFTNHLFCYLVFEGEGRNIMIHCKPMYVPEYLEQWWADMGKSRSEPTLEQLVDKAVNAIKATDSRKKSKKDSIENHRRVSTDNAKNLLSILHSILIKPILINTEFLEPCVKQLRRCKNLVISPQGFLSKVPFGALYDEEQGEFLIQQKTVCVIPSIRTLHRCFQRQAEFEKRWKDLEPPFVAGNPKPMGAGEKSLPGAAVEAQNVAKILDGVPLFSEEKMTKAAVLRGLGHSQVVLLSTHGIINSYYPQGALVLKKSDASPSSSSEVTLTPATIVATETNRRSLETLSPADIVAMPGKIPAGLVVLSACESGLGKVTEAEGVLGLGRAVLQKGAVTTVLTLWKVDDSATTDLITGMFENLRKGWTVPESLQASMVEMINKEKTMYEWAPLIPMGSPKLRLPKYSSTSFEFISTITPDLIE